MNSLQSQQALLKAQKTNFIENYCLTKVISY